MGPRSTGDKGFTLIEILVALGVAILAIGIPVLVLSSAGHGFARQAMTMTSAQSVDGVIDQIRESARTAIAIYTPSSCGTGQPHGDTLSCSSVRFYGKDSSGGAHFWGYEYSGTTLKQCLSYATSSPDGSCTKYGTALQNIAAFSAIPEPVSVIATALGVSAPTSKEYEMYAASADPNGRIVAGNRVMVVNISNSAVNRQVHLLQGGAPFTTSVLHGVFTAPMPGTLASSTNFTFTTPADSSQGGVASESNYSKFQSLGQYSAWYWQVSPCTSSGTTIATVAYNATQSGDTLNYTVTPSNVGSCTVNVSTRDQWFSETIQVYAAPIYGLSVSAASPNYITPNQTSTFTVSNTLTNSGSVRPGYWPSTQWVAAATSTPAVCSVSPSGNQASGTTFTVAYVATGTCTITASGGGGVSSQTFSIGAYQSPSYTISASAPSPSSVTAGGSATFTAQAILNNSASVPPGTSNSIPVGINSTSGPCTSGPAGWQNSGSTFTIASSSAGTCVVTIVANVPSGDTSNGSATTTLTVNPAYSNPVYTMSHTMPASFTAGSTSSFTVSDSQTASNVAPGTPSSVSVEYTSASGCTVSPSGWQGSGTVFTVSAASSGTCSITVNENTGSVANASGNGPQSFSVTVSAPASNPYYTMSHTPPGSFNAGSSTTFTVSDSQTASGVLSGTPSSVSVAYTAASGCSVSPSGWQASGTTFTLTASASGTCTVTVNENTGSVANASGNGPQSFSVSVGAPTPASSGSGLSYKNICKGPGDGTGACNLTVSAGSNVTATDPIQYAIIMQITVSTAPTSAATALAITYNASYTSTSVTAGNSDPGLYLAPPGSLTSSTPFISLPESSTVNNGGASLTLTDSYNGSYYASGASAGTWYVLLGQPLVGDPSSNCGPSYFSAGMTMWPNCSVTGSWSGTLAQY